MKQGYGHSIWWVGILVCTSLMTGCVERRFVIRTNVPGAIVFDEKGQPMGATPVDRQFTYYGTYQFTFVKDGYQTKVVREKVRAPWYEFLFLDFVSENLLPFTLRDVRRLDVTLEPAQMVPAEAVLQEGNKLREQGKNLQPVAPPLPQLPLEVAPPLMPPAGN